MAGAWPSPRRQPWMQLASPCRSFGSESLGAKHPGRIDVPAGSGPCTTVKEQMFHYKRCLQYVVYSSKT